MQKTSSLTQLFWSWKSEGI